MQKLAKFIYYKILGWKTVGDFPSEIDKCVLAVVPHTSNMDFFLGLLIRRVWNEEINWVGKKSLFKKPFAGLFKWLGGAPIDRSKSNDAVGAAAAVFKERKKFRLTLAPEGTRKKVSKWKTGFYYIAKAAEVPIVLISFDYGAKQIKISEPLFTTDDVKTDFETYEAFFEGAKGRVPEDSWEKEY